MAKGNTIARLSVDLIARTALFSRPLNKARKDIRRFARNARQQAGRIAKMGAVAAIGAATGLAFLVRQTMQTIDETTKLARALGLTTEQLTGYQHAAAIAGASNKELTTAFRRMLKNVSDAENGLTTAVRSFDALGLSSAQLIKLSPDAMFKLIADRMGTIGDAATRARVAQDLFGRSGLKILEITRGGAAGIAAMQREAKRLGIAFSDIDGSKIEAANDALTRAGAVLTGVVNTLAIKLAPLIESAAVKFRELALSTNGFRDSVANAFTAVVDWIKIGSTAITRLQQGFNILGVIAAGMGLAIVGTLDVLGLGIMKLVTLAYNFGKALYETIGLAALGWNVAWAGMKKVAFAVLGGLGIKLAELLEKSAGAVDFFSASARNAMTSAAQGIRNIAGGLSGSAQMQLEDNVAAFKDGAKRAGDAWTGMLDNIPTKGPLHDLTVGMAKRTADLVGNVKTLEQDNARFIAGLDKGISDIEQGATRAAKAGLPDLLGGGGGGAASASGAQKTSDFKQISRARFAIDSKAGTGKPQKVEDPQLKRTNQLLEQIMRGASVGGAVAG